MTHEIVSPVYNGAPPLPASPYLELGENWLTLADDTPEDVWRGIVSHLVGRLEYAEALTERLPWLLGDAINFGERRYGETYAAVLSETKYRYGTLRVYAWVCRRFPASERRHGVSFSHYRSAAALAYESPQAASAILEQADKNGHDRTLVYQEARRVEKELREARGDRPVSGLAPPALVIGIHRAVCPKCDCVGTAASQEAPS